MGNPNIHYPGDAPTPCWSCEHFLGIHTRPVGAAVYMSVTCAQRGPFTQANPQNGCRQWEAAESGRPDEKSPAAAF